MRLDEIRIMASELGVKAGKMTKGELIRAIQRKEGNNDCFGDDWQIPCKQAECLWFGDCQPH